MCVCVAPDIRQNNDITTPLFFFLLSSASDTKESESHTAFLSLLSYTVCLNPLSLHICREGAAVSECESVPASLERLQVESIMLLLFIHAQCQKNEAVG